jgi:hypothetical protein
MYKFKIQFGKNDVMCEVERMSDVHKVLASYNGMPKKCDDCGSDDLIPIWKQIKDDEYYKLACQACGAEANFGQYKGGKGLFWKRDKMKVYQKENKDSGERQEQRPEKKEHSNDPW